MKTALGLIVGFLLVSGIAARAAEAYPTRAITVVVPFAAGGPVDAMARLLAAKISENVTQPVIVENRVGGSGTIGINSVAKSQPDGYTILYTPSTVAVSQALFRALPFDAEKDLAPISEALSFSFVLTARPNLGVKTLPELIALAKAKTGKLNFGTAGPADILQMGMEMLKTLAGIDVVPIPYRGQAPILSALLAGDIDIAFLSPQIAFAPIESGRLVALGVTGTKRLTALPNLPTIAEAGVTGYDITGWQGAFAPAATPRAVVERLSAAVRHAVNLPDVRKIIESSGNEAVGSTSEELRATLSGDVARFKKLMQDANIPYQD
jgi:tripartite-type tricarboxylate transporter receptor subunit TctC